MCSPKSVKSRFGLTRLKKAKRTYQIHFRTLPWRRMRSSASSWLVNWNWPVRLSPVPLKINRNRIESQICPFLPPRVFAKCLPARRMVGRGGGDRNDRQTNKACALYALQPPPLANWNKRNKRQAQPSQGCRAADAESQQQLSVWLGPERSTTCRLNGLAGVARFRSSGLLLRNSS
jgi:hypothetical protein